MENFQTTVLQLSSSIQCSNLAISQKNYLPYSRILNLWSLMFFHLWNKLLSTRKLWNFLWPLEFFILESLYLSRFIIGTSETLTINSNKPVFIPLLQTICLWHPANLYHGTFPVAYIFPLSCIQIPADFKAQMLSDFLNGPFLYSHHVSLKYWSLYRSEHLSHHQLHIVKESWYPAINYFQPICSLRRKICRHHQQAYFYILQYIFDTHSLIRSSQQPCREAMEILFVLKMRIVSLWEIGTQRVYKIAPGQETGNDRA